MVEIKPVQKTNSFFDKNVSFQCFVIFYKLSHILFGLNFGFVEIKTLGVVVQKLITFVQCVFICALTVFFIFLHYGHYVIVWSYTYAFQYLTYAIVLLRIQKESNFCNLTLDLRAIDIGLKVKHASYNLEKKLFLIIFFCFAYRISVAYYFCIHVNWYHVPFTNLVVLLATDIVRVTYAFMFYAINCRLKKLGSILETRQSGFLPIQYLYRSIVDIAEQHKKAFDPVLVTALLFNVPQAMAIMFKTVQDIRKTINFALSLFADYVTIVEMLVLSVCPAICAGMLTTQANNIKIILHHLLLQQREEAQQQEIERFIRYVKTRGCRFLVCKILPLDASLIGTVLSFCVTYLIVIVQFSNV